MDNNYIQNCHLRKELEFKIDKCKKLSLLRKTEKCKATRADLLEAFAKANHEIILINSTLNINKLSIKDKLNFLLIQIINVINERRLHSHRESKEYIVSDELISSLLTNIDVKPNNMKLMDLELKLKLLGKEVKIIEDFTDEKNLFIIGSIAKQLIASTNILRKNMKLYFFTKPNIKLLTPLYEIYQVFSLGLIQQGNVCVKNNLAN